MQLIVFFSVRQKDFVFCFLLNALCQALFLIVVGEILLPRIVTVIVLLVCALLFYVGTLVSLYLSSSSCPGAEYLQVFSKSVLLWVDFDLFFVLFFSDGRHSAESDYCVRLHVVYSTRFRQVL